MSRTFFVCLLLFFFFFFFLLLSSHSHLSLILCFQNSFTELRKPISSLFFSRSHARLFSSLFIFACKIWSGSEFDGGVVRSLEALGIFSKKNLFSVILSIYYCVSLLVLTFIFHLSYVTWDIFHLYLAICFDSFKFSLVCFWLWKSGF